MKLDPQFAQMTMNTTVGNSVFPESQTVVPPVKALKIPYLLKI